LIRFVTIVALALFVAQATGAWTLLSAEPECEASCPGDGPHGECPPGCQLCACCSTPRTVPPTLGSPLPLPSVGQGLLVLGDNVPLSPDPDEILHVPKLVLA
jgi:hypothetical protein